MACFLFQNKMKINILITTIGILILALPIAETNLRQFPLNPLENFYTPYLKNFNPDLLTIQDNTLISALNPSLPKSNVSKKVKMVITAYSSTPDQTDCTPFITASNTMVRKGIVANNGLAFGTKVRMPEIFGNKIFVVEDRMHSRKSNYHLDIWKQTREQAINFGIKKTIVEVIKKN